MFALGVRAPPSLAHIQIKISSLGKIQIQAPTRVTAKLAFEAILVHIAASNSIQVMAGDTDRRASVDEGARKAAKLVAADSPSGAMSAAATPVAAAQASSMPAESVAAVASVAVTESVAVTASVAVIGGGGLPSIDTSAVAMATVSASLSAANERERARADLRRSGVGPVCSYHAFRYGRSMRGWRWWRG